MSRWPHRQRPPVTVEPPAWVRVCDVADWRDPEADAQWAAVNQWIVEHDPEYWQQILDHRAYQRWNTARLAWYAANPQAKHPIQTLLEQVARDRQRGHRR